VTILIVGGTKGIGLAIAKAFAPDAGNVILAYHSDEEAALAAAGRLYRRAAGRVSSRPTPGRQKAARP
jgi:NAD(P)-dependent dehydrogenase (short-subunit alcohol dehydrogenase family)